MDFEHLFFYNHRPFLKELGHSEEVARSKTRYPCNVSSSCNKTSWLNCVFPKPFPAEMRHLINCFRGYKAQKLWEPLLCVICRHQLHYSELLRHVISTHRLLWMGKCWKRAPVARKSQSRAPLRRLARCNGWWRHFPESHPDSVLPARTAGSPLQKKIQL